VKPLPKPYRAKNAAGRFTGSYRVKINKQEVNLRTSDANEALERAKEAVRRGRRNFVDEIDEAAAAADGDMEQGGDATGSAHTPPEGSTPSPAAEQRAPSSPPAPATSPALPPMPAADARAEAEATNEAAAEAGDEAAANDNAQLPNIPPEVVDQMLEMAALMVVDGQLQLQAWCIKKGFKVQAGEIPLEMRKPAAACWAAQLKIWIPADKMLPPWAMALLLPALCIPVQLATATPLPDENDKESKAEQPPETKAAA